MNTKKEPIFLYCLVGLFLIEPYYISSLSPIISLLYSIMFIMTSLTTVFYVLYKKYWSTFANYGLAFYATVLVMTLVNKGNTVVLAKLILGMLAFSLVIGYSIERGKLKALDIFGKVYGAYVIVNLVTIILFPQGISIYQTEYTTAAMYFLGHRNGLIKYAIPAICFSGMYNVFCYNRIRMRSLIIVAATAISVFLTKSTTGIIVIVVFAAVNLLRRKKSRAMYLLANNYTAVALNIGFFILIVVLGYQNMFSDFIGNILGKSLTFTGRTRLWVSVLRYIVQKPVVGYGILNTSEMTALLSYSNVSAHNLIADFLFRGGIVCISVLIILLIVIQKRLNQIHWNSKMRYFIQSCILVCSVGWLTDTYIGDFFALSWAIMCVGYYCGCCEQKCVSANCPSRICLTFGRKRVR